MQSSYIISNNTILSDTEQVVLAKIENVWQKSIYSGENKFYFPVFYCYFKDFHHKSHLKTSFLNKNKNNSEGSFFCIKIVIKVGYYNKETIFAKRKTKITKP